MSTYEVSKDHLGFLVNLGYQLGVRGVVVNGQYRRLQLHDDDDRARVVAELSRQNQASVGFLKNGAPTSEPVPAFRSIYRPLAKLDELAQAIQWVTCYRYQSSETHDWDSSFACAYTSRLVAELVRRFVSQFETTWDYSGERLFPQ